MIQQTECAPDLEFTCCAILLDGGRIIADGDPREVVQHYREAFTHEPEAVV